jgi:hypothetical protein
MLQKIYDIFRIPYYHALITRHNEVIGKAIVKQSGNIKSFKVKGIKATFILPNDKKIGIPPVKIKSGRLLVYDVNSAMPMRLVTSKEEGIDWMDEDLAKVYAVNPKQYYMTPLDVQELHNFLEAHIPADIMADDETHLPAWVLILIALGVVTVLIIAVVYLVTHGTPTTITEYIPLPTQNPTTIPTLIPATMKPGI